MFMVRLRVNFYGASWMASSIFLVETQPTLEEASRVIVSYDGRDAVASNLQRKKLGKCNCFAHAMHLSLPLKKYVLRESPSSPSFFSLRVVPA